ncbi:MAG: RluA family pseudouridine synthase [Bacilli bacterium]|nr:RluA family pseudouridine synthase [Bacilli bacterium]
MIDIIYEDNHVLVVEKPVNILVQADDTHDKDLLSILKEDIKKRYQKPGNVYLGLVHRLDRPVGGIMVFAKTSKAASRLSEQVRNHQIQKKYYAIVEGNLDKKQGTLRDYLKKNEKLNKVFIDRSGKESILNYLVVDSKENYSLVDIDLKTGRSHQIRVQFSSRNHPLYGDQKYNKNSKIGEQIALYAYELSFYHPITKDKMTFNKKPSRTFPWSLFQI